MCEHSTPSPDALMRPHISVIIPCYNVAQYISECLLSVQNQSLENIEIIVIDDCSKDDSRKIAEQLAENDSRVRIISLNKNVGLGFVRNIGIDNAKGDYIWFLDSDDYLVGPGVLETLFSVAEEYGSQMVRGKKAYARREGHSGELKKIIKDKKELFFEEKIVNTNLAESTFLLQNNHCWLWLYKREFLLSYNIRFLTRQWEERPFYIKALLYADYITTLPFDATVYRLRPDSISETEKKSLVDVECRLTNFKQVLNIFHQMDNYLEKYGYHYRFTVSQYLHFDTHWFTYKVISQCQDQEVKNKFLNEMSSLFLLTGLTIEDLIDAPVSMEREKLEKGIYQLLFAAFKTRRYDLVEKAINERPFEDSEYYSLFLHAENKELCCAASQYSIHHPIKVPKRESSIPSHLPGIILHVGSSHAGGNYLQSFLELNRMQLLEKGVWYPEVGASHQFENELKQASHLQLKQNAAEDRSDFLNSLYYGISTIPLDIHTIVLSCNGFFFNSTVCEEIKHYLRVFKVSILVCLRRQDEWANAEYCERVGGGRYDRISCSPEKWLRQRETKNRLKYISHLKRWERHFGRSNVTVLPFEEGPIEEPTLYMEFCAHADIELDASFQIPMGRQVKSNYYSENYLGIIRKFNAMSFRDEQHYFKFIAEVQKSFPCEFPIKTYIFSLDQRKRLFERYRSMNGRIARSYNGPKNDQLFENIEYKNQYTVGGDHQIPITFRNVMDIYNVSKNKYFLLELLHDSYSNIKLLAFRVGWLKHLLQTCRKAVFSVRRKILSKL